MSAAVVFTCECGKVCKSRGGLTQHMKVCKANAEHRKVCEADAAALVAEFVCDCGKVCKSRGGLTRHMIICTVATKIMRDVEAAVAAEAPVVVEAAVAVVEPPVVVEAAPALTAYEKEKLRLKREALAAAQALELQKLEAERRAREEALAAEMKKLDEARIAREKAQALELQKLEAERRAREEALAAEMKKLEEARAAEEKRLEEKRRKREAAMVAEEKRLEEARAAREAARLAHEAAMAAEAEKLAEKRRKREEYTATEAAKLAFAREKLDRELEEKRARTQAMLDIARGNVQATRECHERRMAFDREENNKNRAITVGLALASGEIRVFGTAADPLLRKTDLRAYVDRTMPMPEAVQTSLRQVIDTATIQASIGDGTADAEPVVRLRDWDRISVVMEESVGLKETAVKKEFARITETQVQPESYDDAKRAGKRAAEAAALGVPKLVDPVAALKVSKPSDAADADDAPTDPYDPELYAQAYKELLAVEPSATPIDMCVQSLMRIERELEVLRGALDAAGAAVKESPRVIRGVAQNRARIFAIWRRLHHYNVYVSDAMVRYDQNMDADFREHAQRTLTDKRSLWNARFGAAPVGSCYACKRQIMYTDFERAHVVAKAHGGLNVDENIVIACRDCNQNMDTCDAGLYRDARSVMSLPCEARAGVAAA